LRDGERIVKIGQQKPKIMQKIKVAQFFVAQCMRIYVCYVQNKD